VVLLSNTTIPIIYCFLLLWSMNGYTGASAKNPDAKIRKLAVFDDI
jgi:hypothetical protein